MLTKNILRTLKCQVPGCTNCDHAIYMDCKCHPGAGFKIVFDKRLDLFLILCNVCESPVVSVDVAEGEIAKEALN